LGKSLGALGGNSSSATRAPFVSASGVAKSGISAANGAEDQFLSALPELAGQVLPSFVFQSLNQAFPGLGFGA
jgi:hypothetical protein